MNETFICQVSSIKNISGIDEFRCFLQNLAANLYQIGFGYICMGLIWLIIFISIFGKIKESYRWFILYQVLWDLIGSYQFSCDNYSQLYHLNKSQTCFYYSINLGISPSNIFGLYLSLFITASIFNNSYSALFLLSMSRFLALYYPFIYNKLTAKRKFLFTIIIFTAFVIFLDTYLFFSFFKLQRVFDVQAECKTKLNLTNALCENEIDNDYWYNFFGIFERIFTSLTFLKPVLFLLSSIFAAIMIILKVLKQAKFQRKHKPKDFYNSLRISIVIFLQTLINLFVLILESIRKFEANVAYIFGLNLLTASTSNYFTNSGNSVDFRLPLWLDGIYGLTSSEARQMVTQIRVFIESVLVLLIMTGYREAIIAFVKFIYSFILNQRKAYEMVLSYFRKKKISETSLF